MKNSVLTITLMMFLLSFQETEHSAVLKTIDTFLKCIETRDAKLMRTVLRENGRSRFWNAETGEPGEVDHRIYLKDLPTSPPASEKIIESHVRVDGTQASVWGRYEFYLNDSLTHCGSEVFSLEKTDNRWMIVSIDYTIETGTCK